MSITKRQGIGGNSSTRKLAQHSEKIMYRGALVPDSRNGKRIMRKLREKYGDKVIDREINRLNNKIV